VLLDGRMASGSGSGGRVLVWDPDDRGTAPVQLGRHDDGGTAMGVTAMAALPDGRIVTGGWDRRVLAWDPDDPGAAPVELGRHDGMVEGERVWAVAVLPDGRVVSAGGGRVRLWDVRSSSPGTLLACSAYTLATSPSPSGAHLFIGHAGGGISYWEVRPATRSTPGARQRAGNAMHQQT
jgi:WD40 repeat protein